MTGINLLATAAIALVAAKINKAPDARPPIVEVIEKAKGDEPRGIRNRNPGNLTELSGGQTWKGQISVDRAPDGHNYVVFSDHHWGLRACARLLRNYQRKHGLKTVQELISRYAPPVANPTSHYVEFVEQEMQLRPHQQIDLSDAGTLVELVKAVVRFECGYHPFSALTIMSAVNAV